MQPRNADANSKRPPDSRFSAATACVVAIGAAGRHQHAADEVAKAYRTRKLLARVYLPEQDLKDGIVTIAVIEGRLGDVRIEHDPRTRAARLSDATVRRVSHQYLGDPLQAGDTPGQSRLVVKATDEPLLSGYAQLDNSGAILVGGGRGVVNVSLDSPFGIGDQAAAFGAASTRRVLHCYYAARKSSDSVDTNNSLSHELIRCNRDDTDTGFRTQK